MFMFINKENKVVLSVSRVSVEYPSLHYTTKTVYKKSVASLTDTLAAPVIISIVYGRFTLSIIRAKWPYTIGVKYLTS